MLLFRNPLPNYGWQAIVKTLLKSCISSTMSCLYGNYYVNLSLNQMKKILLILLASACMPLIYSQLPQGFNYQAIARDGEGNILSNQNLALRLSIYQDQNQLWTEEHAITTNDLGLFSVIIGDPGANGSGSAGGNAAYAVYASGNMAYTGSFISASDVKFKQDIESIPSVMPNLMKIKPRKYNLADSEATKSAGISPGKQFGFVAQELEHIFPELVVEVLHGHDGPDPGTSEANGLEGQSYKGVKYLEMIPLLLKGLQEQQEEIEHLKLRIAELEAGL